MLADGHALGSLGLSIVAEGVETEETLALLRTLGCDIVQGWLFVSPAPAERIDAMVLEAGAPEVRLEPRGSARALEVPD